MTPEQLDNWFTYHAPTPEQLASYDAIRKTAKVLAYVFNENVPESADKTAAMRSLRLAVMQANAAIACGGK